MTSHPTSVHYENEVAFFRAFLDPYLKYTSGLYVSPSDSDDAAMVRMLDKHIELAAVPDGGKLLDVGCGWGSLARRLKEVRPDVSYVGLTPSGTQARYVREHAGTDVALELGAFEDTALAGPFDAIVMSGTLCHLRDKRAALERAAGLLSPSGRLVVEDTFFVSEAAYAKHAAHPKTRFVQRDIFGFAEILPLGRQIEIAAEAALKLTHALENSDCYRRTIDAWIARLAALDEARFPLAPDYVRYLQIAQAGWSYTIVNYVLAFARTRAGR